MRSREPIHQVNASGLAERLFFRWRDWPSERGPLPSGPRPDIGNNAQGEGSGVPRDVPLVFTFKEEDLQQLPDAEALGRRGLWLVSDRCRDFLVRIDGAAFDFAAAQTVCLGPGEGRAGPQYWVCDVVRFLAAMDESPEFSAVINGGSPHMRVWPRMPDRAQFKKSIIASSQIFRATYFPNAIYCTDAFKLEFEDLNLTGLYFYGGGWAL